MHLTIAILTYVISRALIDYLLEERDVTIVSLVSGSIFSMIIYGVTLEAMLQYPIIYNSVGAIMLFIGLHHRLRYSDAIEHADVVDAVYYRTTGGLALALYPILLGYSVAGAFHDN